MQFGESIGGRVGFTLELFELKNKHEVPFLTLYDLSGPTSYYEKKCLYYVIIHTKFGKDQMLNKKDI